VIEIKTTTKTITAMMSSDCKLHQTRLDALSALPTINTNEVYWTPGFILHYWFPFSN